jgi:tetratricopeptide (TPR) repeat protein
MRDQYDNVISTSSDSARDHYIKAVDLLLAGQAGISAEFNAALEADPGFALGHAGLARAYQFEGKMADAKAAADQARALANSSNLDAREKSHINAFGLLIDGKGPQAYKAIRAHVNEHPRDAIIAQTCSSVFGLIGFSGQPGREAEILAYMAKLLPHYGEDWWCLSQYAFALCENGRQDEASETIDRSLALNPRNANAAHVRSHIDYERGDTQLGIDYLTEWLKPYDRGGYLHGHLSWHAALWSLEQGDTQTMWQRIDEDVAPGASEGLPINILTDTASILYRAELAGVAVSKDRWKAVSDYARQFFPNASLGFCDIHAALAHAMAGDGEALVKLIENPNPLTGDLVTPIARAYRAIASDDWSTGVNLLSTAMADHARLGGSRAQRDLLEFSLMGGLLKLGKDEEASRMLMMRRPALMDTHSLHGLNAH